MLIRASGDNLVLHNINLLVDQLIYYLCQGSYDFIVFCLFVCLQD